MRSKYTPHVPIGLGQKSIRREIERRLDAIQKIAFEPQLILNDSKYILKPGTTLPPYYYRQRAVDDVKLLENEIFKQDGSQRHPRDNLRSFLMTSLSAAPNGSASNVWQRLIHQFCDMYEHARYDPNQFNDEEYQAFKRLLLKLLDA